ncbi:MAG: hypothetical protein EOP83_12320 [Verrucomicrobiaceae bacterium]|nr:MAG: hypothetical protein EOP83_12320 [Verrucomicrobiaceae bacterium]
MDSTDLGRISFGGGSGSTRRIGSNAGGPTNTVVKADGSPTAPNFAAHDADWNTIVFVQCPGLKQGLHHIQIGFSHVNDGNWPTIASWYRIVRVENYTGAQVTMVGPVPCNVVSNLKDVTNGFFTDESFSGNQLFAIQFLALSAGGDANVTGIATPNQAIVVTEWA